MSQEETKENSNREEIGADLPAPENIEEIDNLPIESIGSYARLEELLTDEEKEDTTNPAAQS